MWTYFFELRGAGAKQALKRVAADLSNQGLQTEELLRSADQPDLYLLQCTLPAPLENLPVGPKVWQFVSAESPAGN